jgi:hypothetical protein
MIKRTEIILAHMGHSARESTMMVALTTMLLGVLIFLSISRVFQRIAWGLTSDSKSSEDSGNY